MRKLVLLSCIFVLPIFISAQEISENLESYQVTTVGENILLTGFKPLTKLQNFIAILYDKNLTQINRYQKTIADGVKSYYVGKSGDLFLFTFYSSTLNEKYRIALDGNFMEKFAAAPDEKTKNAKADDNTVLGAEWTYEPGYCNYYFYGDVMLEAQMESITCYSLSDPVKGNYTKKWEKDYSTGRYVKMNLVAIDGHVAYYFAVEQVPRWIQTLIAIDIDNGTVLFSTDLNSSDTLDAVSISNIYVKDQIIYAAGTFVSHEENETFAVMQIRDDSYQARGFDSRADYFLAGADGYFVMALDSKSGAITNIKTFDFPSINKTVDYRDFRMAVCQGIKPLKDGKILAFFELISCAKSNVAIGSFNNNNTGGFYSNNAGSGPVSWETDAFTSVVFSADFKDASSSTFNWDEDSSDYGIKDYDIFSLVPRAQVPHDFCTLDDEGCYVENFVCDGTNWDFEIHSDDTKMSDFIIRGNENEMKSLKILPPGLLLLRDTNTGLQLKDMGETVKLKIFNIN